MPLLMMAIWYLLVRPYPPTTQDRGLEALLTALRFLVPALESYPERKKMKGNVRDKISFSLPIYGLVEVDCGGSSSKRLRISPQLDKCNIVN